MTSHVEIWRVAAMCGLWALAIALILNGAHGMWFWVAIGAVVIAGSLEKRRRRSDGGGGGWFGDGDGDGGDGGGDG